MGIFKRTKKYSKPSKELDKKIKNLDEGLKKTDMISSEKGEEIIEEVVSSFENIDIEVDENKSSWRESFDLKEIDSEVSVEFVEELQKESKNLSKIVESKLKKNDSDIEDTSEFVESFQKAKKYSKPSKDLDEKIKNLDNDLKKTNIVSSEESEETIVESVSPTNIEVQIFDEIKKEETEELYDWRDSFITEDVDENATQGIN